MQINCSYCYCQVVQLLQSIMEAAQNVADSLQSADSSCDDSWLAWFFSSNVDYHASRLFAWFIMVVITVVMVLIGCGLGEHAIESVICHCR